MANDQNTTEELSLASSSRRRWFRFSLRSLLLMMLLVCAYAAWDGQRYRHNRQVHLMIDEVKKEGHRVYSAEFVFGQPQWFSPSETYYWDLLKRRLFAVDDVSEFYVHEQIGRDPQLIANVARRAVGLEFREIENLDRPFLASCMGPRLQFLVLDACTVPADLLVEIPNWTHLENLRAEGTLLQAPSLEAVAAHRNWVGLQIRATATDLANMPPLQSREKLREFNVELESYPRGDGEEEPQTPYLASEHLRFLQDCRSLQHLTICCSITDATAAWIAERFPELRSLRLEAFKMSDDAIRSLLRLPKLEALQLGTGCKLSTESQAAVAALSTSRTK